MASRKPGAEADQVVDPHCVESDLYDRAAIARLRASSTTWRRLDAEGERLVPHFPALLDDLFCALFKYNVVLRPTAERTPGTELARRVVAAVMAGAPYAALRATSVLDEPRAGLGAVLVGEALLRALREDRVLTQGDLLDLWNLERKGERAAEAQEAAEVGDELERAAQAARSVGSPATPSPGPPPRRGRPTREQAALRDAARAVRLAARGAAAEREQKRRQVNAALDRVGAKLERSLLLGAAQAATRVADLPEALAAWGRGLGAGGARSAGQSIDLGRRLADNPKLRRLAGVFGRMRESALAVRRRVFERADEEVHEIRPGRSLDDLARLVPHELLALSHPLLRRDFQRRLLDGGLATYALRGLDSRGHGPLIVCLDVSSSMAGDKELWSKAVTLTFVELARRQRRRARVLCFSSPEAGLRRFDLNPRAPYEVTLEQALDLAEHFPGGGTDFETPLRAAVESLAAREMRRADVVLITDGECAVTPELRAWFERARRQKSFSLYTILIDVHGARRDTVRELSDRVSLVSDLRAEVGPLFAERGRRSRAG